MGVLAYEMATATLPFTGATMPALLGAMLRGRPADPRERQPTLPRDGDHFRHQLSTRVRDAGLNPHRQLKH